MRTGFSKLGVTPCVAELVIGHAKGGIAAIYDKHRYGPEIATALARLSNHVMAVVAEGRAPVAANLVSMR